MYCVLGLQMSIEVEENKCQLMFKSAKIVVLHSTASDILRATHTTDES